jgi:hypothetical protein
MNINDYTYHLCDRFILLFVAFVGLVGTSYILMTASNENQNGQFKSYSIGIPHNSVKKTIDKYTVTLQAAAPSLVGTGNSKAINQINLENVKVAIESSKFQEVASNSN